MHIVAPVGVAAKDYEYAAFGHRCNRMQRFHSFAQQRTVENAKSFTVVEPFAWRVERTAHIFKPNQSLLRRPSTVVSHLDFTAGFHGHGRRIDIADSLPRRVPFVDGAKGNIRKVFRIYRDYRRHRGVRGRYALHIRERTIFWILLLAFLRHTQLHTAGGQIVRHGIRRAGTFGAAPVHPKLLEPDRVPVHILRHWRGPHTTAIIAPTVDPLAADEGRIAIFSNPADRCFGCSRIHRREHERLCKKIRAPLHADSPCASIAFRLRRTNRKQRFIRRHASRRNDQFASSGHRHNRHRENGCNDSRRFHRPASSLFSREYPSALADQAQRKRAMPTRAKNATAQRVTPHPNVSLIKAMPMPETVVER